MKTVMLYGDQPSNVNLLNILIKLVFSRSLQVMAVDGMAPIRHQFLSRSKYKGVHTLYPNIKRAWNINHTWKT